MPSHLDHPMQRATDQSKLAVINAKLSEYRVFIWPLVLVLLALGFKYTTPNQRIEAVDARVDGVVAAQLKVKNTLDSLVHVTTDQSAYIKSISLLQCFNTTYTNGQLRLVGIDCTGIRP